MPQKDLKKNTGPVSMRPMSKQPDVIEAAAVLDQATQPPIEQKLEVVQ